MKNKVAIVTGGGSGIGRSAALKFAKNGAKVVIADIMEEGGNGTVSMITEKGGEAIFVNTDVSNPEHVKNMVDKAVEKFGRLDYAFNNAGIGGHQGPIHEFPENEWDKVIAVNLKGVFLGMKYEIDQMITQGDGGVIVNTSSILGKVGFAGAAAYTAAKHGVMGLTKVAAQEYGSQNIRICAINPGFIHTPMLEGAGLMEDPDTLDMIKSLHPLARLGKPEEIGHTAVWLCSEEASFISGTGIEVDGAYLSR